MVVRSERRDLVNVLFNKGGRVLSESPGTLESTGKKRDPAHRIKEMYKGYPDQNPRGW